jgi:hypothetical protein
MVNITINGQDFTKYLQTVEIQRDSEDTDNDNVVGVANITISDIDKAVSDILSLPLPDCPNRIPVVDMPVYISKDGNPLFSGCFDLTNIDSPYLDNDNITDSRSLQLIAYDNLKTISTVWSQNKPIPISSMQDNLFPNSSLYPLLNFHLMPTQDFLFEATRVQQYVSAPPVNGIRQRTGTTSTFFSQKSLWLPCTMYSLINAYWAQAQYINIDLWNSQQSAYAIRGVGPSRGTDVPDYASCTILDVVSAICQYRDGRVLCLPNGELIYAEKWQPQPLGSLFPTATIPTYTTIGIQTFPTKSFIKYNAYNPNGDPQFSPNYYTQGSVPGNVGSQSNSPGNGYTVIDLSQGIFAKTPWTLFCSAPPKPGNAGAYGYATWEFLSPTTCSWWQDSQRVIKIVNAICLRPPVRFKILTSGYNYFPLQQAFLAGNYYTILSTTIRPIEDEAELIVELQNPNMLTPED